MTKKDKNIVKDVPVTGERPTLALVMMIKNEHKRITVSLDSVKDVVDCMVILDTGSEDDTVNIVKRYCETHKKPLHLIEKTFPQPFHYSNARNAVLDFADDKADYLLLLDCNDELRGANDLRKFINSYSGAATAFHVCQEWWNGTSLDKYYNIRLVKSKNNWRYKGAIHEYILCPTMEKQLEIKNKGGKPDNIDSLISRVVGFSLYQDRTKDDDKSFKRFARDEDILNHEYQEILDKMKDDPTLKLEPRNLFYYGQTCMCLGKNEKAYKLYKQRTEVDGFTEEKYHAYYRCGELSKLLNHDWEETMTWYIKAYEYSTRVFDSPRAEPLYRLAEYYRDKCWDLCFLYLRRCCEVVYPDNAILFVDRRMYDYSRWNLMGIVAFYVKQYEVGKYACLKAIAEENQEIDRSNLVHYVKDKAEAEMLIRNVKKDSQHPRPPTINSNTNDKQPSKDVLKSKLQAMKDVRKKK